MEPDTEVEGGTEIPNSYSALHHDSINAIQYENRRFQDNNCISPRGTTTALSKAEGRNETEGKTENEAKKEHQKEEMQWR
jgi:hypothetical protein